VVEVLIPWRGGCPHRERALAWCSARYPWKATLAVGPEPWVKGQAIAPALERSEADVVVVADADVWCDHVEEAVAAVNLGAPWALPHRGVFRLNERGTELLLADDERWRNEPLEQRAYLGTVGGGIVVAPRELLLEIPLDPRFVGWGQEDESWGAALETRAGRPHRGRHPLLHLWHPPQPRMSRRHGSEVSRELGARYEAARGDADRMKALIEEARCLPPT
jgi:hypothetical protein